jgi:hypothetical protein
MSIGTFALNSYRGIYKRAASAGFVPRRPFAHYYLNSDGLKSRIHLQNFYSSFWPDVEELALATIKIYNSDGVLSHKVQREIEPFGQMYLEMEDFAESSGSGSEGMVFVDLEPGQKFKKLFSKLPELDRVEIRTPFWMSYRDENENYMYVHSISTMDGEVKGAITPIEWALSRSVIDRPSWKSWRLLDVQLLEGLQVVAMNHSKAFGETNVAIYGDKGEQLWSESVSLSPRQVKRVRVPDELISEWKLNHYSEHVRIGMSPLLSSNGKPYIVMKYAGGPMSLHHG